MMITILFCSIYDLIRASGLTTAGPFVIIKFIL